MTPPLDDSAPPAVAWLPAGYLPLGPVRHGPSAATVRAVHAAEGRTVIAKRFQDPAAAEHQASLITRLPATVAPRVHAREAGVLILEYMEGRTLEQSWGRAGSRLSVAPLLRTLSAIAEAVETMHLQGVIHRDLKPSNILLRADGGVTLLDFESALCLDERQECPPVSLLTPGYAAPEQYRQDGPEGPWTDVYALSAIAFRGLTGSPPLPPPSRPDEGNDIDATDIPPPLRRILKTTLALDPSRRTRSAADYRRALLSAAGTDTSDTTAGIDWATDEGPPTLPIVREPGAGSPPPDDPGPSPGSRSGRKGPGRLLVLLLLLAATLAAAGWLARPWYERHLKQDWLIDGAGAGDARSIGDALARAGDGAVLRVRPGLYRESLQLHRPVALVAADPETPPVVSPDTGPCIAVSGDGVLVQGMDLRAPAPAEGIEPKPCVVIGGGEPRVERNHIAGDGAPAVLLGDGTAAVLQGNIIRSSAAGIVVAGGARASIGENTLTDIAGPALLVRAGASPSISSNVFEKSGAVVFGEGSTGTFRNNTLRDGQLTAIEIGSAADPEVSGNTVERPAQSGIYVYGGGRGWVHDNRILSSALSGIVVDGGAPRLTDNQILESGEHGILVIDASGGQVAGNVVRNSKRNGIAIGAAARIELGSNTLQGNAVPQLVDLRRR